MTRPQLDLIEYTYHSAMSAGWDGVTRFSTTYLDEKEFATPFLKRMRAVAQREDGHIWANILPTGSSIHRHNHSPSTLTAVMFLTDGPPLEFDTSQVVCRPGEIAVFRSDLDHWVSVNNGPDRLSLAMIFP